MKQTKGHEKEDCEGWNMPSDMLRVGDIDKVMETLYKWKVLDSVRICEVI